MIVKIYDKNNKAQKDDKGNDTAFDGDCKVIGRNLYVDGVLRIKGLAEGHKFMADGKELIETKPTTLKARVDKVEAILGIES